MSAISDYLENQWMLWAFTANAVTRPTDWYVALFSAAPGDSGGGTEISGGSYARQQVTWNVVNHQAMNTAEINFVSSEDWPVITHVAVMTAPTGGQVLFHGALAAARDPALGDTIRFAAGQLILQLD